MPTSPPSPSATPTSSATPNDTATASPTATRTTVVANALIEGPVTAGGSPWIQSTRFDLAEVGYAQAEFFMTGTAQAYTNVGELDSDGTWSAAPADSAGYKTRILVYRPIDPQRFNGTVIVEWLNVSAGLDAAPDWTSAHTELVREGYAWVGVSVQRAGIEGPTGPLGINLTLKGFNPMRYGSLSHPGDSFSYDIFSQAGQAVRNPQGLDPLDGLRPARIIAAGESQSAFRLTTYVNAIHPVARVYDGFMIHSRGGGSAPLSQAPQPPIDTPDVVRIRTDLQEPVLVFQTETDLIALGYLPDRQPDTERFRLWEVAGTAHADTYTLIVGFNDQGDTAAGAECLISMRPIPGILECDSPVNSGPQHWVLKAAFAALDRWVRGDGAPPIAPRLELEGDQYVLDEFGNVRGGIRTPAVDVPIATLSGLGQTGATFCRIFGTTVSFDAARLASLYPTTDAYVSAVNDATDSAVDAGFILPPDGELIKAGAAEFGPRCREM
jgi:Alpha/beta hydrolase domain